MAIDYSDWAAGDEEVTQFNTAPFDYASARKQMLARIDRTTKQLNNEKVSPRGGKDFETLHNGGVHYRPTLNGHPVQLPGLPAEGVKIHRDKLKDRLKAFAKDIEDGHFNEALKDIFSRNSVEGAAQASTSTSKAPRKRSTTKGMKPWEARTGYADLPRSTKQVLAGNHRVGLNPDRSPFKDGEYNPNASPIRNKEGNEL